MNLILAAVAAATTVVGLLMVAGIFVRRNVLGRRTARETEVRKRLRPLAITIAAGAEIDFPTLAASEAHIFAEVLTGLTTSVRGAGRERLGTWAEDLGLVEPERAVLRRSRRPWKRASAAHLLGRLCSRQAIPDLTHALADRHPDVREVAALGLGRIGDVDSARAIIGAFAAGAVPRATSAQALLMLGANAAGALREGARDREPLVQRLCIDILGFVGGAEDGVTVIPRLQDESAEVRGAAARTLGRLGSRSAVAPLIAALRDPEAFVRGAAAEALGRLGAVDARDPLLRTVNEDPAWWVAKNAAHALAAMDPRLVLRASVEPGASPHLVEAADVISM